MYVVTEYGSVNVKGKSVPERAKAITSIPRPGFRKELERQACENRLIRRGVSSDACQHQSSRVAGT
jgi:acyl-CoA hydrolase